MANFSFEKATSSSDIKENVTYNESETTHSIVDQFGNAIAATTLMRVMVLKYYCDDLGLNNEMDDFSAKAGVPICLDSLEMKQQYCLQKDAEFHDTNHCRKERDVGFLEVRRLLLLCCKRY
jgi:hypothetical protein